MELDLELGNNNNNGINKSSMENMKHFKDSSSINANNEPKPMKKLKLKYDIYHPEYESEYDISEEEFKILTKKERRLAYKARKYRNLNKQHEDEFESSYLFATLQQPDFKLSRIYNYIFTLNEKQNMNAMKFYFTVISIIASFVINILQYFTNEKSVIVSMLLLVIVLFITGYLLFIDLKTHFKYPFFVKYKINNDDDPLYEYITYHIAISDTLENRFYVEIPMSFPHARKKANKYEWKLQFGRGTWIFVNILKCIRLIQTIKLKPLHRFVVSQSLKTTNEPSKTHPVSPQ
jgi:hypothetical protein